LILLRWELWLVWRLPHSLILITILQRV